MNEKLIAIVTCARGAELQDLLPETWIPLARQAGFDVEMFDGKRLNCDDGYLSIMQKSIAIYKWALERGYRNVLKVDDDTYIRVDRLRDYGVDYGGHIWTANDYGLNSFPKFKDWTPPIYDFPKGAYPHNFVSGGAVWLSRKSVEILATAPPNGDFAYDRWAGDVLARAGVPYTFLTDFVLNPRCAIHPSEARYWPTYAVAMDTDPARIRELHRQMLAEKR